MNKAFLIYLTAFFTAASSIPCNAAGSRQAGTSYDYNNDYDYSSEEECPDYSYLSEDMLIGSWSPDQDSEEPSIIEFYYNKKGQLCYYYYRLVKGNGNGFNRANETTEFEYTSGHVFVQLDDASCMCFVVVDGEYISDRSYIDFYLSQMNRGVIVDQSDGTEFVKIDDGRMSKNKKTKRNK